jgi:hypothetical protein
MILGFGIFIFFLPGFLVETLFFPVIVFLFMIRPPLLNLFFSGLVIGIFLLVDDFPVGLSYYSSIMMTFSLMAGSYTTLDFNLNLFRGLVPLFHITVLY